VFQPLIFTKCKFLAQYKKLSNKNSSEKPEL
jgi:hypothetical protein